MFTGTYSYSQVVGKLFPEMHTETANDTVVNLPSDIKGKYSLVGMAYSKKSEDDLNTWIQPIFTKFIQKPTGLLAGTGYDINVYFVPMFTGVNVGISKTAKKEALKKMDPYFIPYILFYKGELKSYKQALEFEKRDTPYFFLLDSSGTIVYATSGEFTENKLEEIQDAIPD